VKSVRGRARSAAILTGVSSKSYWHLARSKATQAMRTTIVIDDKLMNDALKATGAKTKREAVELGLKTLVDLRRQEQARQLRGKITWEGDLDAMRTDK